MTPEEKTIETAIHCLGVRAEQEVCEECPAYLEGGIACREVARAAISALEELQQYREIGTVEECREAVKKQKLKTPGRTGMDEQDCYICPNCGADIGNIDDYFPRDRYCHECGQAIQWNENLEGMEDEQP